MLRFIVHNKMSLWLGIGDQTAQFLTQDGSYFGNQVSLR